MTKKQIENLKKAILHKKNNVSYKDFIDFLLVNNFIDFCLDVEPKLVFNDLEKQYLKNAVNKFKVTPNLEDIRSFINQEIENIPNQDDESFYRKRRFLFKTNNREINVLNFDISYLNNIFYEKDFSIKENKDMNTFNKKFYDVFMSKVDYFMYESIFMLYAEDIAQETRFNSEFDEYDNHSTVISPYFLDHKMNNKIGNFLEEYTGFFIDKNPSKYKNFLLENLNSFINHIYVSTINKCGLKSFNDSPISNLFNGNKVIDIMYKDIYNMDINFIFDIYNCNVLKELKLEWLKTSILQNNYIDNINKAFSNEDNFNFFDIEIRGRHITFDRTNNPVYVMKTIFECIYIQKSRYETILKLNFFYKTDFKLSSKNSNFIKISKYLINHKIFKNSKTTEESKE
jgi:hypothetical protein